jgi:hypothetical protein
MVDRVLLKKRFLGFHLGEIFKGQIDPFYIIKLGTYTYYYLPIVDLYNEVLLSISTTSWRFVERIKQSIDSGELSLLIGKYALTYQDRVLTSGSLKVVSSKSPDFLKLHEPLRSGVSHVERFIKTPSLYSQLALFPIYTFKDLQNSWRLYNKNNTRIIVNPEGQFCRAGLILGILGRFFLVHKPLDVINKLPYIEYYPSTIVGIKSIACRPSQTDAERPLKCISIHIKALINKDLVPQIVSSRENIVSGLLYLNWCPKLGISMPVLVGLKDVTAEELANFIFGKALLLSSLEGDKFRILIPEELLRMTYNTLVREIEYRLGITCSKNVRIENIIKEHEQRNLLFRLQKKLVPITMKLYLSCRSILNSNLKQIVFGNIVRSLENNGKKLIGFSMRKLAVKPLESRDNVLMII